MPISTACATTFAALDEIGKAMTAAQFLADVNIIFEETAPSKIERIQPGFGKQLKARRQALQFKTDLPYALLRNKITR